LGAFRRLRVPSDSGHHALVHEGAGHPTGRAPPAPVEPHGAPAVASLPAALSDRVRPAEQAGQLLLGTIDQWNAALVAEARRVVERDHVGVPLDEMGAEVEPGGVVRTANHDATLH